MHAPEPFVSIVIPTRNRPQKLRRCLTAIAEIDYPGHRLEVVVVDDAGTESLDPILVSVEDRLNIRHLRSHSRGPAAARNEGARRAEGELLAFTDDDCRPDVFWLRRLVESWDGSLRLGLGGHTVNALVDNLFSATSQLIVDVGYAHNNDASKSARFLTSNNLIVPAEGFRTIGGFDQAFRTSEDRDFCDRWVAHGFSLGYVPDAIVYHEHDLTIRSFTRQQFAYGRGASRYHRAHARRWNQRITVEPSFYAKLFLSPFRHSKGRRMLQQSLLLQAWNLINVGGFFYERARAITNPTREHD